VTDNEVLERLRTDDVALKLTHGEGEAYYAWLDGDLNHYRDHPQAESAEPGEESRERFAIDAKYLGLFDPKFIPLESSPFDCTTKGDKSAEGGSR